LIRPPVLSEPLLLVQIIGGLMLLALHGPGGISLDKGMKKAI
jgi:uncharacterized membrane protein YphA (DoxX/SURF4 family)